MSEMTLEDQRELLTTINEGEVVEFGHLFKRLNADEPIVWEVLEVSRTEEESKVTFTLYWLGVYWRSVVGTLTNKSGGVSWELGK